MGGHALSVISLRNTANKLHVVWRTMERFLLPTLEASIFQRWREWEPTKPSHLQIHQHSQRQKSHISSVWHQAPIFPLIAFRDKISIWKTATCCCLMSTERTILRSTNLREDLNSKLQLHSQLYACGLNNILESKHHMNLHSQPKGLHMHCVLISVNVPDLVALILTCRNKCFTSQWHTPTRHILRHSEIGLVSMLSRLGYRTWSMLMCLTVIAYASCSFFFNWSFNRSLYITFLP